MAVPSYTTGLVDIDLCEAGGKTWAEPGATGWASGAAPSSSATISNIDQIKSDQTIIKNDISTINSNVGSIDTSIGGIESDVGSMIPDLAFIKQIEQGRWKIVNNQMIFYGANGVTPIRTFNLKDRKGEPTELSPYERVPVE